MCLRAQIVGCMSAPVSAGWRSGALMGSLITCVEKDMLTGFFCALAHWPPWTVALSDWPSACRGQQEGPVHLPTSPDNHKVPSAEPSLFLQPFSASFFSSCPSFTCLILLFGVLHYFVFSHSFSHFPRSHYPRLPSQLSSCLSWPLL